MKADASLAIIFSQLEKNFFLTGKKQRGYTAILLSCGENLNATIVKDEVSPYHTVYQFLNRA